MRQITARCTGGLRSLLYCYRSSETKEPTETLNAVDHEPSRCASGGGAFPGLFYVTVSAHLRPIQQSMLLFHAEGGTGPPISRPNVSVGLTREQTVSERNGDNARFGRERRHKILGRKRTRELETR